MIPLITARAGTLTVVVVCAELFDGLRSTSLPPTPAVVVMVPATAGATTMLTFATAPAATLPMLVTTCWPLDNVLVTMTPVAVAGPRLVTQTVLVMGKPTKSEPGELVIETARSVNGVSGAAVVRFRLQPPKMTPD